MGENVLLKNEKTVKLIDFGTTLEGAAKDGMYPMYGNVDYQAPEMLSNFDAGTNTSKYAGREADMWALGVTVYMMLTGRRPFSDAQTDSEEIKERVKSMAYSFPADVPMSDEATDLVARLLTVRGNRITADQLLRHPWIQKFAVSTVTPQKPMARAPGAASSPKSAPKDRRRLSPVLSH